MTRLLIVTTVPLTMNAFLMPFVDHFKAKGWRVDGMARGIEDDARCRSAFDRVWDIDWSRNPVDPRNFVGRPQRVRAFAEREGYDLVHVHTPVAAFVTRYALRARRPDGPRVVYTAHGFHFHEGGSPAKNALFLGLERIAARWTDAMIVINRDDELAARRHRLMPEGRLYYMPGIGVNTEALRPEAVADAAVAAVRGELGLPETARLLLMTAEFNPGKRHRDALQAFARLGARGDAHLAFAGAGPEEPAVRALAAELGVGDRVHFLGWRQDVPAWMRAATATLLPSEREGLPRSVMESLALGVPTIGTDIRGMRDLLADGGGWLVPVGDVARLAEAMAHVLDHPGDALEAGRIGRERMAGFDVRHILAMHERVYSDMLGQPPGA